MVPETSHARVGDGSIAYQALGSGCLDLVQLDIGDAPDYHRRVVAVLTSYERVVSPRDPPTIDGDLARRLVDTGREVVGPVMQ